MIRTTRFRMLLVAIIFSVLLQIGCNAAAGSIRERICINEDWSFYKYDLEAQADKLIYDVRPGVKDTDKIVAADEMPMGNIGVTNPRFPSTTSASTLSKEPRMRPPFE